MPPADSPAPEPAQGLVRGRLARLVQRVTRTGSSEPLSLQGGRTGLVLHLGDFKTGTTAIQTWLGQQGAASGIITPPGFNQAELAQSLTDPDLADRIFAATAAHLAEAEAHHPEARHAVISAEHFELADPARLAAMIARHLAPWERDMRLIAYVRPHPAAYLARFAESTKIGSHDGDLDRYLDLPHQRRRMTYAPRFTAWRAVFGDRFTLRLYDRAALTGGDVVRDFAGFVTGQDPGESPDAMAANPTPGLAELALLRALHRAIGPLPRTTDPARWTLGRQLGRQLEQQAGRWTTGPHRPLRLHRALAERLAATFAGDAAETDATFLGAAGAEGPLTLALARALDEADPQRPSLAPEDHLTPEALSVIALWGGMLRHGLMTDEGPALMNRIYHE